MNDFYTPETDSIYWNDNKSLALGNIDVSFFHFFLLFRWKEIEFSKTV